MSKIEEKQPYGYVDLDLIDTTGAAPDEEPARQHFFMAKCRQFVQERELETGRKQTCFLQTFGCQMNAKDSEKLRGILYEIGYSPAESEEADLVLYNTCTVRENANLKVYGHLGYLSSLKKKNPQMIIGLCGCMMQETDVVEKLKKSYRFVNLIFGTHNIYKFAELLYAVLEGQIKAEQMQPSPLKTNMVIDIWKDTDKVVENLPADRTYSFKCGVNIMYGCNNFCTYCIVPYVRGRERSRRPEEILREIRQLSEDGVIEVMLLGQNVNSYGKTLDEPVSFAQLLQMVEQVPGIERIRFMTSHPKDLSDELIAVMKQSKKICRHLHLPLQSGSSRILKKMNRRYTKEQYLALAAKLRREIPDISLTTDIIVGFPGETEEDFQETLDVVRQVRYDSAFTFLYSRRTGTPAAAMEDQVPDDVAKERFNRLLSLVQGISQEMSKRVEGQTLPVLVESGNDHDPSLVTGRLSNNLLVHFPGTEELIGQIVDVRLTECKGFYYMGTLPAAGEETF
ncbi:MAG: tRNA (N6-isopentenyl adenosine(37)-C2)-methylthiotransferase MiaB [Lachnospiraceae bacterium]|nr:tRNA (N6-isopentenyl adenosine(37)-C2)-methylthiotransferase MiaB [Lachnospiraceae bacterium]